MARDPATVDALREHRRHQLEERIVAGPAWQDEQTDHVGPRRPGRHEVKVISERLGYANVTITIDTYGHVLPAAEAETARTVAKLFLGGL